MDQSEATILAVKRAGGHTRMAEMSGVSRQAVQQWIKYGRVPADKVLIVEDVSGVSRHLLRPDVFGADPGRPTKPPAYMGGSVSQVA